MKVFVATPVRDGVTAEYAQSLFNAGLSCAKRDIEVVPHIIRNSCFIDIARSVLVKNFLDTDCTHLFFVDSDIGFESKAMAGLVEAGVPFCAGVYRKREPEVCFAVKTHEPQEFKGPWLRVNKVATGFMCLERHVLEEMSSRVHSCKIKNLGSIPMVFTTRTDKVFVSEDYCFCDDYNHLYEEGVFEQPIWIYPDITFNHDGFVGNFHKYLVR